MTFERVCRGWVGPICARRGRLRRQRRSYVSEIVQRFTRPSTPALIGISLNRIFGLLVRRVERGGLRQGLAVSRRADPRLDTGELAWPVATKLAAFTSSRASSTHSRNGINLANMSA